MNDSDLGGRCALVTGASGGIGAAIASALHGCGVRVALSGRRQERLAEVAGELAGDIEILPCNLSQRGEASDLVSRAIDRFGGLDILVNVAGLTRDVLAMRMRDEDWDEVIAVNLTATMILSRSALRPMMKKRWGRIINITSVVGTTGNPGQINYAASKAGLAGLTKSLAAEVASRGITVNCIAPGFIDTDMTAILGDERRAALLERIPLGRMGKPDDVAQAVRYLAAADYVTGQTIHVNGGLAMI